MGKSDQASLAKLQLYLITGKRSLLIYTDQVM